MDETGFFDPGLFRPWLRLPAYDGGIGCLPEAEDARQVRLQRRAGQAVLEVKSREQPPEALRRLLNDMTDEMRAQFDYFCALRGAAAGIDAEAGDEAAAKLARADVKAATDAMSLIVRTLEKIDTLQRQLARDRDMEAERDAETRGLADARAHFIALIEQRAEERFEQFKRDRLDAAPVPADNGDGGEPPGAAGGGSG